ncbi:MAG: hypothetical protein ACK4LB_03270 [Spirosomataceae bacterium]
MKNILTFFLFLSSSMFVVGAPKYSTKEISMRLSKSEKFFNLYKYTCKNIIYLSEFHSINPNKFTGIVSDPNEINEQFISSIGYGTMEDFNLVVKNFDFLRADLNSEFPELRDLNKGELEEIFLLAESMLTTEKRQVSNPKLAECVQNAANRESHCLRNAARGSVAVRAAAGATFASCLTAAIVVSLAATYLGELVSAGLGTALIVTAIVVHIGGIVGGCSGIAAAIFGTAYEVSNAAKDQCKQERLIEIRKCVILYKD